MKKPNNNKNDRYSEFVDDLCAELTKKGVEFYNSEVGWPTPVEQSIKRGARVDRLYAAMDKLESQVAKLTFENALLKSKLGNRE